MKSLGIIWRFLCLMFQRRRYPGSGTVLLIFQSPQYYGTHTYFKYITEYFSQRGLSIHLLVSEEDIDESVMKVINQYGITVTSFNRDQLYYSILSKGQPLSAGIYYVLHILKQLVFLLDLYRKIKPRFTFISVGYPSMWFPALYLPGSLYYIQHVMPGGSLDRGSSLLLRLALFLKHSRIIAVSDFCGKRMTQHWGIPPGNIDVISNYYEGPIRARIPSETIRVVSVARADVVKNPVLWADLGNKVTRMRDNVVFIWAGVGDAWEDAKRRVENPGKVRFLGFRKDVAEVYADADIYFTPAKSETQGIAVVGAMFYELPVIATSNGGTADSVVDGETGFLVDVTDEQQMIDRLLRLIDNETLRLEMGKKAKERFDRLFTRQTWTEQMDRLLRADLHPEQAWKVS